jgi:hypothetical protein
MTSHSTLPTIWRIPDDLWNKFKPHLGKVKAAETRTRPVVPHRTGFDGTLYVLRTGCQSKARRSLGPLATEANRHNMKGALSTIDARIVSRPRPGKLCG